MTHADPLFRLVNRVYQGALEPQAWPGIVQDITEFFRSPKGLLLTNFAAPEDGGVNISTGISQRTLELWNARYIPHDRWTAAVIARGLFYDGAAAIESDLVSDEEFAQSKIYQELLIHEGVGRLCACIVFAGSANGVMPTTFGVYRAMSEPRYTPEDREHMRLLAPHLSRSLGVMYRLRDAELKRVASLGALDRLHTGVALLDARGAVHHLNAEAQRILRAGDGLALRQGAARSLGELATEDGAAAPLLAQAIAAAVSDDLMHAPHFSSAVHVSRRWKRRPYALQFAPLPASSHFETRRGVLRAIVFITDPEREVPLDEAMLRHMFEITPAEARLARRLCAGVSLAEAAQHCAVAESTAKSQLAAVYEKTNTHTQAQLVRLLLSLSSTRS